MTRPVINSTQIFVCLNESLSSHIHTQNKRKKKKKLLVESIPFAKYYAHLAKINMCLCASVSGRLVWYPTKTLKWAPFIPYAIICEQEKWKNFQSRSVRLISAYSWLIQLLLTLLFWISCTIFNFMLINLHSLSDWVSKESTVKDHYNLRPLNQDHG